MEKIIVIGGGASGLLTAIYAANNKNKVIILERNNKCGKKLLITGNGRCNYFNEDQSIDHYHSSNNEILKDIITRKNIKEILTFFEKVGIVPKLKNGYYYPFSNQAISVQYALLLQTKLSKVEIKENFFVEKVYRKNDKFMIISKDEIIEADKIVIATGSKAFPKTGSDGSGYQFVKNFGHSLTNIYPALVQLKGNQPYFKKWSGIRCDVRLNLYEDENKIKEENGEIQLTDYGVSGICILNLSRYVSIGLNNGKKEYLTINFVPWIKSKEQLNNWLEKRNNIVVNRNITEFLEGILNYKLVNIILNEANIDCNKNWNNLTKKERESLIDNLYAFHLDIVGTNSFDKAQVCTGGVPLDEINPLTMESLKVKNLFLVGELLDVDGDCGGYNLSFAWITGMLAGKYISGDLND